jgi:microcystin degradation protein MlrC
VRIAITGYAHEVNGFADPVTRGHGLDVSRTPGGLAATWEAGPLVATLVGAGAEVVELPVWEFGASGPLDGAGFRSIVDDVVFALRGAVDAAPLDAVVVLGHGAGRTTDDTDPDDTDPDDTDPDGTDPDGTDPDGTDPDGTFLHAVRGVVGPSVPVVVVLDFHANLSDAMCDAVDAVVGYRTNPHVDIADRVAEAGRLAVALAAGARTTVVHARLPMVLPQIAQLTTAHEPFGEVLALPAANATGPVRNVSVFGGFSLSDVECSGASVCVTVDEGRDDHAAEVVRVLARALVERRDRFRLHATPLAEAVRIAAGAASGAEPPVLLADVADNPGGGAPATSTFVLRGLLDAAIGRATLGVQCDPAVVEHAWRAGIGATIEAVFNRDRDLPLAPRLAVTAEVVALTDAPLVPSRGVYAGSTRHPGRCCGLRIGGPDGITVGVSSAPVQCADDDTLRHCGLEPDRARVVVVKSRGHFRAGFDHLFGDDRIVEVGAPGVATPELHTLTWRHLPRPVFPLDTLDEHAWRVEPRRHRPASASPGVRT